MILHDSRDERFRSPFGAQPAGGKIRIRIACDEGAERILLRLWWDDREILMPMHTDEPNMFRADLNLPDHAGLMWYHFVLTMADGRTIYYGNASDMLGGAGAVYPSEPPGYQITVHDPHYDTPGWMKTGVMYHIMVDRFCASTPAAQRPAPCMGRWHTDWYEDPELNYDSATTDNIANDFFGGDLKGIESKLPYLQQLGVTVLYLSPIFQSRSNHKYNTGDYMLIDPSFGTETDYISLCAAAKRRGIRVMLDGVFSHTGSDSRYFNKDGRYDSTGAHQSRTSPYYSWYNFSNWPDEYESWWGFLTLPVLNKHDPTFLDFILRRDDSVFAHWLRGGASGWRLDVADELPMGMLREMRARLKALGSQGALLGEVWEDASNKVAYGEMRSYCLGDTLDSVMNYPLRDALFAFLLGQYDSARFARIADSQRENYPRPFYQSLMNLVGSHDRARAINVLSGASGMEPDRRDRSAQKLTEAEYSLGRARLLMAMQVLMALPGMPSIYYGDEAGMQGMSDPFCRGTFPWGREDAQLQERAMAMVQLRNADRLWSLGEVHLYAPDPDVLVIVRTYEGRMMYCAVNRAPKKKAVLLEQDDTIPEEQLFTVSALSTEIAEIRVRSDAIAR